MEWSWTSREHAGSRKGKQTFLPEGGTIGSQSRHLKTLKFWDYTVGKWQGQDQTRGPDWKLNPLSAPQTGTRSLKDKELGGVVPGGTSHDGRHHYGLEAAPEASCAEN